MAHLLVVGDQAGGAAYSVHATAEGARLALADTVLSGSSSVHSAEVVPVEVEQTLTASVGPQQTAALREALGVRDSAFPFAQLIGEVRRLVELAGGAERIDLARKQGDALRTTLGARPDTSFDDLIGEVESLVDGVTHTATEFEIPGQPRDVTTVWSWDQQTGGAVRWDWQPGQVDRWVRFNERGEVVALCTWYELMTEHAPLTSKDPHV